MLSGTFLRGENPKWYFFLLDGTGPVTPTAYISFLSNTFPYLPQNVYMDPLGQTVWGQPIEFDTSGSIPDNIYFDPTLVYRIEIRNGPTSNDPLIVQPIENYTVGGASSDSNTSSNTPENFITNPQFAYINFGSPDTLKLQTGQTSAIFNIAPGWFLQLTGPATATSILTQNFYSPSGLQTTGNPETSLTIANQGWTSAVLYQQFKNGGLFANNGVCFSFLAKSTLNIEPVTAQYVDNAGAITVIFADTITQNFNTFVGAETIPANTGNAVSYPNSYVQMQILLPGTGTIEFTNMQMFSTPVPISLPYEITTIERQRDHMFNVYAEELIIKPKNSILAGWNFSLNPFQFSPVGQTTIAPQTSYICDQTILYQQVAAGSTVQTFRDINETTGLQINSVIGATNNQFALINYIAPQSIASYWGSALSSLVRARLYSSTTPTPIGIKMRIITRQSLAPLITGTEPIASWAANGDPVFAAGWTAIVPMNDPTYILPNSYSGYEGSTSFPAFSFDSFILPAQVTQQDMVGVVIYTTASMATTDIIVFQRVSLVPNRFAVDSHTETFDEAFKRCQFYYEKSYDYNVPVQTSTANGSLLRTMNADYSSGNMQLLLRSFGFAYKQTKNITPIVNFWSASTGTVNALDAFILLNGSQVGTTNVFTSTDYTQNGVGLDAADFFTNKSTTVLINAGSNTQGLEALLQFHYTLDSRLGLR
jgi:hypothetical protein